MISASEDKEKNTFRYKMLGSDRLIEKLVFIKCNANIFLNCAELGVYVTMSL
uniref:Uncharacterized protein n=1 Tax=Romanomermis culicivorax TaxID=13658 RepID=A0A915HXY9_ROMCU